MLRHVRSFTHLNRFTRNEQGLAMIEFALILPLLVTVFYGVVELTRFILMQQKLDNATHTIVDVINQNLGLTNADLEGISESLPAMVAPYDSGGWGIIITSVQTSDGTPIKYSKNPDRYCGAGATGTPITLWQRVYGAPGGASRVSSGQCNAATVPDLSLMPREQVIAVEVYLKYKPVINGDVIRDMLGLDEQGIYKVSFARPRYGTFEFEPK